MAQSFTIRNEGGGVLNAQLNYQAQLKVTTGFIGGVGVATVDPRSANLAPGTYYASISVSDGSASDSPQVVNVTVTVLPRPTPTPTPPPVLQAAYKGSLSGRR